MKVLSHILFKGDIEADNLPSVNGGTYESLFVDSSGKVHKGAATGGSESQGGEDKVNVADGSGGWLKTNLHIYGALIRHKDGSSGIELTHDGQDDDAELQFDKLVIKSDNPTIKKKTGEALWVPTNDHHLVNKRYVDDKVAEAVSEDVWVTDIISEAGQYVTTKPVSLSQYVGASVRMTLQCFASVGGDSRLSAEIVIAAAAYKHNVHMYIGDLKVVSHAGMKVTNLMLPPPYVVEDVPHGDIRVTPVISVGVWTGEFKVENQAMDNMTIEYKYNIRELRGK